jgi:hypothetical protein
MRQRVEKLSREMKDASENGPNGSNGSRRAAGTPAPSSAVG